MSPRKRSSNRFIYLILLAALVLGTLYSITTPLFEAGDELWHYPYIKHIADGNGLPVQDPTAEQLWEQEGGQPPLYYIIAALATAWIDTSDLPQVRELNPHARIGQPHSDGNKNMVLHPAPPQFPWRGTTLAVHIVRFLSVLMAVGTVYLTYRLARELFPSSLWLARGAAMFTAFNPMFLFIGGAVNNDNLAVLLASLTLWWLTRLCQKYHRAASRDFLILGVLLGLAALTKVSTLGLTPLAACALLLNNWRLEPNLLREQKSFTRFFSRLIMQGILTFIPVLLIAGWWYVRNYVLYGDFFGWGVWFDIAGERTAPASLVEWWGEFDGFRFSYWGVFGGFNIVYPAWIYFIFDLVTIAAMIGLFWLNLGRYLHNAETQWGLRPERDSGRYPHNATKLLIPVLWIIMLLFALLRWTSQTLASQGRLIFPAIAVISVLLARGLSALVRPKRAALMLYIIGAVFFIIALVTPFAVISPAYSRPPIHADLDIDTISNRVHIVYNDTMELIGYRAAPSAVKPGETLRLTLYWRALANMIENHSIAIHLAGRDGEPLAHVDTYPGRGMMPTSQWGGGIIEDTYHIDIAATATAPVLAPIELRAYTYPSRQYLPSRDLQGHEVTPLIGKVKIAPRELILENQSSLSFDHKIAPLNPRIYVQNDEPRKWEFTVDWQALAAMDEDYTVFAQILDADNQVVAQDDHPPLHGQYPTSYWERGEIIRGDSYSFSLPAEVDWTQCRCVVGWYAPSTGQRLPLYELRGDSWELIGDSLVKRDE